MIQIYIDSEKIQIKTVLLEILDWSWRFGIIIGFVYLVSPILNHHV